MQAGDIKRTAAKAVRLIHDADRPHHRRVHDGGQLHVVGCRNVEAFAATAVKLLANSRHRTYDTYVLTSPHPAAELLDIVKPFGTGRQRSWKTKDLTHAKAVRKHFDNWSCRRVLN